MPAEAVFIDTVALLALVNSDDELHERAAAAYFELTRERAPLVTSEWVLLEFLNGAAEPPLRPAALALVGALRSSARVTIVPASHEGWEQSLEFYAARPDKGWSFVDCASILACHEREVRRVLTRDRHFVQAGFDVLLA